MAFPRLAFALVLLALMLASPALRAADAPPGVGDAPPDFTLEDQNGRAVTLSAEWKSQPVVLIFYRGHW